MEELNLFDIFNKVSVEDAILSNEDIDIFEEEVNYNEKMLELIERRNKLDAEIVNLKATNKISESFFDDLKGYVDYEYCEDNKLNIFYSKIRKYISDKYGVELSKDKELYPDDISLKSAKKYITSLLGGKNVYEIKKEQETKYYKSLLSRFSFDNKYKYIDISKNKVTIQSFLSLNSYSSEFKLSYEGQREIKELLNLISFYESNNPNKHKELGDRICYLIGDSLASKFELDSDICKSIKLFKNRKVTIEFIDEKRAMSFIKEYTDYNDSKI